MNVSRSEPAAAAGDLHPPDGRHTPEPGTTERTFNGIEVMSSTSTKRLPAPERIPITLIGGYLGAGKTSLLNHLLTHVDGERIAVLVNDFGALGLDAALVARRDAETVTLTNGCVCCSIADDFGAALDALIRSPEPPSRIVVETSGVAETGKTARYAGGWPSARLDAVLTMVDLETIRTQAQDRFVGDLVLRQIDAADVIVANKSDRVDSPTRRATTRWLARRAPRSALVETCHGRVAPAIVLGVGPRTPEVFELPPTPLPHAPGAASQDDGVGVSATRDHENIPIVRVTCRSQEPYMRGALTAALDALPSAVVRFKGVVRLRECPDQPYVLQGVGRRWSLEPAPPQVSTSLGVDDGSAIDFLGVGPAPPIQSALRRLDAMGQSFEVPLSSHPPVRSRR